MAKRWVTYVSQNIPGNQSFQMEFCGTLSEAKDIYVRFCDDVGSDDCTMTVYHIGDNQELIDSAIEFENVGCPFDYADRIIARGPKGGVLITRG